MLAIDGGTPIRDGNKNPWPAWPVWSEEEKQALVEVLESGGWSYNGPKETEFLKLWQEYSGAGHVLLVANGTVTLQLVAQAPTSLSPRPATLPRRAEAWAAARRADAGVLRTPSTS